MCLYVCFTAAKEWQKKGRGSGYHHRFISHSVLGGSGKCRLGLPFLLPDHATFDAHFTLLLWSGFFQLEMPGAGLLLLLCRQASTATSAAARCVLCSHFLHLFFCCYCPTGNNVCNNRDDSRIEGCNILFFECWFSLFSHFQGYFLPGRYGCQFTTLTVFFFTMLCIKPWPCANVIKLCFEDYSVY